MLMGIGQEYIQKSTPEDNGDIESFHNSLKTCYILVMDLETFEDAKKLMKYAFSDYNRTRPYLSIDYLPPEEFERRWMNDHDFRKQFLDNRRRKEEKILRNREEKKRRLKGKVSLEEGISAQK